MERLRETLPYHFASFPLHSEVAGIIREKDWSGTLIGDPQSWSPHFKSSLSLILNSSVPLLLMWGPDLVCFYNDSFTPSLGKDGKHPHIIGLPAKEAWSEIWDTTYPLIQKVLVQREALRMEDVPLAIYRNGQLEEAYWTFSYNPIIDDTGLVQGIFVTADETTTKVNAIAVMQEKELQYNFVIDAADLGTWDLNLKTNTVTANSTLKNWFGIQEEAFDLSKSLGRILPDDYARVRAMLDEVANSKSTGNYEIKFSIIDAASNGLRYIQAKGKAVFDENGLPVRFSGIAEDITTKEEIARKAAILENRFGNAVRQAPIGICILQGPSFIVETANKAYLELVDRREEDFIGRPLFESLPEVQHTIENILSDVLTTGSPYHGIEFPVTLNRYGKAEIAYFNFTYKPFRDQHGDINGVMAIVMETTLSVKSKHALTESERQFRNMVMQSPIAMTIFRGKDFIIETANKVLIDTIWRKKEEEVMGKPALEIFPELKDQKYAELLQEVFATGKTHRENEALAWVQGDDGMRKFYLDFEYRPLFEPDNSVSGIIITVTDVTEKVEARLLAQESEKRLNIVIEASELGTWEWNMTENKMTYSNRFLELFGYPPNTVLRHEELVKHLYDDDLPVRSQAYKEAFETGSLQYSIRVVGHDGKLRWMEVKGKVFFDEQHQPFLLVGTSRDTTDENDYQQELESRERKFRLLADSMPQLVWTGDARGNINYFNQSVYDFSGLSAEELMTENGWTKLVHPEDRETNMQAWMESINTGKDYIFEHRFKKSDGQYRWHLSRAIAQRDAFGYIRMWVGASTDIQEIKELDQQKDLFIGMASHELKTPITTVKGYVQLLQSLYKESTDDFLKTSLDTIHKQIVTLTDLIADLLDLSKIKSGSLQISKENFDISDMTMEIVSHTRHINPGCQINFAPQPGTRVYADRHRLSQVLINFLTNAIKYSPEAKTIEVAIVRKDQQITISVKDEGIGISKKDQDKIFERFYRVEGKSEKTFPGFGIGLFISAEIIKKHQGRIGVESKQGKGSTFYFSIPAITD